MGATGVPELSHDGDGQPRARERLPLARFTSRLPDLTRRPSPLIIAAIVVCMAVAFVAALTYYGARAFTSRAADERAAEEAASFARHSSLLATGDAFNGYLQILRYAEDPIVASPDASRQQRRDAMQQLLWLNTNKMDALAIADRSGLVFVSTDPSIQNVRASTAFNQARAGLGPANSDIILPEEGEPGYVEYASPIRDASGVVTAFLYARAEPQVLWRDTLNATIDGGHNVIINSEGLFSAGVPDALLKQPWTGAPLDNGGVRADVAGVDSICGLGAIGKDTQIDHGWFVASCLPVSLIQVEAGRALGNQGQITIAGAVLAIVVAIGLLRLAFGGSPAPASPESAAVDPTEPDEQRLLALLPIVPADDAPPPAPLPVLPPLEVQLAPVEPQPPAAEPSPPTVVVVADVDALSLIDAYERRNALLSAELRETIQVRLMIAATQAEEAYRLVETNPERARALHRAAIDELESLRERELRGMSQELHPSLVRLGLPGALRSLQKEFEGQVAIDLALDPTADGASSRGGRITIDPRLRLVVYRIVRDAIRALLEAGITEARVAIERDSLEIAIMVTSPTLGAEFAVPDTLMADEVAIQAFGGSLIVDASDALRIVARVIAPHVDQPEPEITDAPLADDDAASPQHLAFTPADPELTSPEAGDGQPEQAADAPPIAAEAAPSVTDASTVAEADPAVNAQLTTSAGATVDLAPPARAIPPIAVTFRLPEDEPDLPEPIGPDATAPADEEDLPKVVQVSSLAEIIPIDEATAREAAAVDAEGARHQVSAIAEIIPTENAPSDEGDGAKTPSPSEDPDPTTSPPAPDAPSDEDAA